MTEIELRADQSYRAAGQAVVAARAREMFARAEGVLDTDDPGRVHKMRVATRRLRAALEVFGAGLARKRTSAALADVKKLASVLGERRDCDVQIDLLNSLRRDARSRAERAAIDQVVNDLRGDQVQANKRLRKALAHVEDADLERRLRRIAP
ncbi:MAG TPA: CHAD domain-containing protein [Solirubrobacteraceae bacterium]|jgi:CHAD domain-containing protein|nr:CHAD domain-containing protein [Solirubrobacteraceae bacterium]